MQTWNRKKNDLGISKKQSTNVRLDLPASICKLQEKRFPCPYEENPYPAQEITTGDFIRKLTYPDTELGINKANVDEAIARQGGNKLDTRVWWDKP